MGWWLPRATCVLLVAAGPSRAAPRAPRCFVDIRDAPKAASCTEFAIAGMEASGSTLAWQVLNGVVALAQTKRPVGRRARKHNATLVSAYGDPACVALTYRDPRDVVCSHAKRRGVPGQNRSCAFCDAAHLEARAVGVARRMFPFHAKRVDAFREAGSLILRYENFIDCPEMLAELFAHWLGVHADLPKDFAKGLAAKSSLQANWNLAERLKDFGVVDEKTQIHGGHISYHGNTGAWHTCLTPDALTYVENRAERRWMVSHGYAPATPPAPDPVFPFAPPSRREEPGGRRGDGWVVY